MKKLKLFFRLIGPRVVLPILMGTCILLCCPQNAYSTNTSNSQNLQEKVSLSGIVIDEFNNSVIGASLVEVGTSNWTITDNDGKFSLSVPIGASIKVSFIGFKDQIIKVNSKAKLTIKLIQDAQVLNDVVVVGFGTQKKINLTGSVAVVDDKEISSRPISNTTQALQGLVPGLQVTSTSGSLESNPSINVRGQGTIGEGSSGSPLILIDGMEGDINTINP